MFGASRTIIAVACAAMLTLEAPALAVTTTFAAWSAVAGTNIRLVNSGAAADRANDAIVYSTTMPTDTAPGSVSVNFSFINSALAPFVTNVSALYNFSGVIAKNSPVTTLPGGIFFQPGLSANFSFLTTSAIMVSGPGFITTTFAAGSNLLSGSFTGGTFVGQGTSGSSFASGVPGPSSIQFTSDFLDFSASTLLDRSQSLTAVARPFAIGANGALRGFRGVAGGSFSANPRPTVISQVPEPETWSLMVLGFGLVGAGVRRRRQAASVLA
jgi:hypothetical protein